MHTNRNAAAAGAVTPTNDGAPAVCGDRGPGGLTTDESRHFPRATAAAQLPAERKLLATIKAELALLGYSLHELACGGFLIARWDRTTHCADLRQAREFLQRVGGGR